jgi:CPA2 family monovalent cation:H+ antiporter-2
MATSNLSQVLMLLASSVLVLSLVRRFSLPPIIGYLVVGMVLGPNALGLIGNEETVHLLAEFGVVFLVFTLGLEFSLARMVAMKSDVFGIGGLQMLITTAVFGLTAFAFGIPTPIAIVLGGSVAMSSTAVVLKQLGEQLELPRTHARLGIGILLFQDLAFVPLLALTSSIAGQGEALSGAWALGMVGRALLALVAVLAAGRWLLRPLFREIARHRSSETFTLTVFFVVLGGAWLTETLGLSMAMGAFLAGMLLAETEFRYQTEAVIKPFGDILLGLFFITVGMLLDARLVLGHLPVVLAMLSILLAVKALIVFLIVYRFIRNKRKALRTGLLMAMGGEFGFALLTVLLNARVMADGLIQALLTAIVLSMMVGSLLVRYNRPIADWLLRREVTRPADVVRETAATRDLAEREHVIICGFGRVGQNLARILQRTGFEFIALDLDPFRVRDARLAGDTVVYGDASNGELLRALGLEHASVVVISFNGPDTARKVVREIRQLRSDVPVLVRTDDDTGLDALRKEGATEVIAASFETSLSLASHVLMCLKVPVEEIVRTNDEIRHDRYSILRSIFRKHNAPILDHRHSMPQQLRTVILPPAAYGVGRCIRDLGFDQGSVVVKALRRDGIVGRDPDPGTVLRKGDVLILYGAPEDLERAESTLLMG